MKLVRHVPNITKSNHTKRRRDSKFVQCIILLTYWTYLSLLLQSDVNSFRKSNFLNVATDKMHLHCTWTTCTSLPKELRFVLQLCTDRSLQHRSHNTYTHSFSQSTRSLQHKTCTICNKQFTGKFYRVFTQWNCRRYRLCGADSCIVHTRGSQPGDFPKENLSVSWDWQAQTAGILIF